MTQEKFSRQVMAMQPTLYRLSCSLLRCEADREDAVQSAIEKAWRNRFFLRRAEGFRPWLTRILVNECYTLMRTSARRLPADSLPENARLRFVNANDGTCEGVDYLDAPIFTVQFHPEACAGPQDTAFLFDRFLDVIESCKK